MGQDGPSATCSPQRFGDRIDQHTPKRIALVKGEVHEFYRTSWFVEFEALSQMLKLLDSCDKPFKRYSRSKLMAGTAHLTQQSHTSTYPRDVIELYSAQGNFVFDLNNLLCQLAFLLLASFDFFQSLHHE